MVGKQGLSAIILAGLALAPGKAPAAELGLVAGRSHTTNQTRVPLTERHIREMKALGATTIRVEFEDRNGIWTDRVAAYQNILGWTDKHGLKVIGLINLSSINPSDDPEIRSPNSYPTTDDFKANYAPAVVEAFKWHDRTYGSHGSLEGWEMFNEPDITGKAWYRGGTFMAEELAYCLVRVAEEKKFWYPTPRLIIFPGMSRADAKWNSEWLWQKVFNTTSMKNFRNAYGNDIPGDAVALHAYGKGWDPASSAYNENYAGTFRTQLGFFLGLKDDAGRSLTNGKPIYLTEMGAGFTQAGTEAAQAAALRTYWSVVNEAAFGQIKKAFIHTYRDGDCESDCNDPNPAPLDPNELYGLRAKVENGDAPIRLAWNMMRNFTGRAGVGQTARWGAADTRFLSAFKAQDGTDNILGAPGAACTGCSPWVHTWENGPGQTANVQDLVGAKVGAAHKAMLTYVPGDASAAVVKGIFYDAWMAAGGGPVLGYPYAVGGGNINQHAWNTADGLTQGTVQDFRRAKDPAQQSILCFEKSPGTSNKVQIVRGAIFNKWYNGGNIVVYGYPRNDQYWDAAAGRNRQDFARGTIYE